MNGKVSYVVLAGGGDNGLQVVRHPAKNADLALAKATEESLRNPGQVFYVAQVCVKVVTPRKPVPMYETLT